MEHDLISEQDFAALPDDANKKFIAIEGTCRGNMNRLISNSDSAYFGATMQEQYMAIVAGIAEELGIEGVVFPTWLDEPSTGFSEFVRTAQATVARLRLRQAVSNDPQSTQLGKVTYAKLEQEIQRIRRMVNESDLSDEKQKALNAKLDELASELRNKRVSFGKVMAVLAHIGFTTLGASAVTVSVFADLPDAIANIVSLIGKDKEAEDKEAQRLRLPSIQPALPAPSKPRSMADEDFDEEIPF